MKAHHPPHIVLDATWHLVTAATVGHARLLATPGAKETVRDTLKDLVQKSQITLLAWVVLDNHYHLLLKPEEGRVLSEFCRRLHGRTAREINLLRNCRGRQVWHNYWDSSVRSDVDLWTRFNYIHHNPVKHGYVTRPEAWTFSSYGFHVRARGEEWLADCWMKYPVLEYIQGDTT